MLEWIKAGHLQGQAGHHWVGNGETFPALPDVLSPVPGVLSQQGMEGRAVVLQKWGVPHINGNEQGFVGIWQLPGGAQDYI